MIKWGHVSTIHKVLKLRSDAAPSSLSQCNRSIEVWVTNSQSCGSNLCQSLSILSLRIYRLLDSLSIVGAKVSCLTLQAFISLLYGLIALSFSISLHQQKVPNQNNNIKSSRNMKSFIAKTCNEESKISLGKISNLKHGAS